MKELCFGLSALNVKNEGRCLMTGRNTSQNPTFVRNAPLN